MKKRTGTKALSIALAAALCMTGLAGCGSKTQETQGSTAAKTEAGETPAELKPVTLKLWSCSDKISIRRRRRYWTNFAKRIETN